MALSSVPPAWRSPSPPSGIQESLPAWLYPGPTPPDPASATDRPLSSHPPTLQHLTLTSTLRVVSSSGSLETLIGWGPRRSSHSPESNWPPHTARKQIQQAFIESLLCACSGTSPHCGQGHSPFRKPHSFPVPCRGPPRPPGWLVGPSL